MRHTHLIWKRPALRLPSHLGMAFAHGLLGNRRQDAIAPAGASG